MGIYNVECTAMRSKVNQAVFVATKDPRNIQHLLVKLAPAFSFDFHFSPAWYFQGSRINVGYFPVSIYRLKVNNRDTRTRCEICSKLTLKTPERRYWRRSGVFIVNFEHISHLVLVFLLFEQVNSHWVVLFLFYLLLRLKLVGHSTLLCT